MATATNLTVPALIKTLGRHHVQGVTGVFLKVLDESRAYWVWRFRFAGREHEISLGQRAWSRSLTRATNNGDCTSD